MVAFHLFSLSIILMVIGLLFYLTISFFCYNNYHDYDYDHDHLFFMIFLILDKFKTKFKQISIYQSSF